jgi:hypothetical protein
MKILPCTYLIQQSFAGDCYSHEVLGFAVDTEENLPPELRFAIHETGWQWSADHWDSGFSIYKGNTKDETIKIATQLVKKHGVDGFKRVLEKMERKGFRVIGPPLSLI